MINMVMMINIESDLDGLTAGFQILNCSVYVKVCGGQSDSVTEVTPPGPSPGGL